MLALGGLATGVLSGLFGVGGGFLIVPALVLIASLPMQRVVATSLLVIAIISASGGLSHGLSSPSGPSFLWEIAGIFVLGGLGGMGLGALLSRSLSGAILQKIFATGMVLVALYMLMRLWITA